MKTNRVKIAVLIFCALMTGPAIAEEKMTQTPTQAWLEIRQKEFQAKTHDDTLLFRTKASAAHDVRLKPEEEAQMMEMMKLAMPKNVRVTKEIVDGNKATLEAEIIPEPASDPNAMVEHGAGKITLGFEDGQWKLDKENWQSQIKTEEQFEKESKSVK